MGRTLYWNPNTLILPRGAGMVRLFQAYDRRNVLANLPMLNLIDGLVGGCPEDEVRARFESCDPAIRLVDATCFSIWDHAYANADFLDPAIGGDNLEAMSWPDAAELLLDGRFIVDVWPPPVDTNKRHFGDRFRGSFFEQLATESLYHRTTPSAWWTGQKFEPDHLHTRPTPYRFVEEKFLEGYFREHFQDRRVLEIGCGTGFFTAKMARTASQAIGLDYNPDYIKIAKERWPASSHANVDFRVCDILALSRETPPFLREPFDFVVLIDTFLFLFDARFQSALYEQRHDIMRNLKTLLKPGGLLLVMDPHPLWLTPWLGAPNAPVGILSEYRQRRLKVIPTLEELTGFLCESGYRIRRLLEPDIDEAYRSIDPMAYAFYHEVPPWLFMEIEVIR